jgi:hypothetical protein
MKGFMDTLGAKEQERQGKIFKEIAEVLSETGELKPYGGMKEDRVTSKFNDLLAQHAKKATEPRSSHRNGRLCDARTASTLRIRQLGTVVIETF